MIHVSPHGTWVDAEAAPVTAAAIDRAARADGDDSVPPPR
ncbi:hypothetical protein DFR69_101535 [Nocardia neocaledoniensis]|uniref:Uncharacterized protein n=1 Tax=Nocardia neocaledoniensis TaxID=236511 RepID=A0A317P221_9NOCA|nr:hypothetical protein DFR69_101535 [Nocardia neocaledoniensis]